MDLPRCLFLVFCLLLNSSWLVGYKIPKVRLDVLSESFRVSIPDEDGVKITAFNVNRNREFTSYTPGEFSAQVRAPVDNRWSVEFKRRLNEEDVIYVWTNVQHNQLVYREISDPILVCKSDKASCGGSGNHENQHQRTTTQPPQVSPLAPKVPTCLPTLTVVPYRQICKGELIFEDNFDSLNASIWTHEVRAPLDTGDAEFVLYDTLAQVQNGQASFKPILWSTYKPKIDVRFGHCDLGTRCTGTHDRSKECRLSSGGQRILKPVVVPRVNTRESFNFKFGRVEIRAKLPMGDWLTPLLLLEPLTEYYGQTGYESGQLRVAFARGNEQLELANGKTIDGRILYGGAVLFLNADRRDEFMATTRRNLHFGNDFHIYALTWTPEELVLEVDNKIYGRIPGNYSTVAADDALVLDAWKRGTFMAPFDRPFYISLGLSAGGFGDYPDNLRSGQHTKPWQNYHPKAQFNFWDHQQDWMMSWQSPELLVDYVRVYAL